MTATISNREKDKLPDWAASTANQIEDLGFFKWVFDWEYPVPDPGDIQRVQIRDEGHVGQKAEVNLYAEAMKRGDKFPPGVVSKDRRVVDWNTRARAAHKLGWPTAAVFVIQEDYEGAEAFVQERFHLLGAAFNTGGPKPLTRDELTEQVRRAAANPDRWDTNKVAKHLHVPVATVQTIFAQFRAEKRAADVGVPFNGSVTASTRALLGKRSEKLANDVFKETARLAQDAGLTTSEVGDLCKRVVEVTTGDPDRLEVIANERATREQQITQFRAGGRKRKPPLSTRVRTCAEFLTEHTDEVAELTDTNPNTRDEFLVLITNAAGVLERLVTAQAALIAEARASQETQEEAV